MNNELMVYCLLVVVVLLIICMMFYTLSSNEVSFIANTPVLEQNRYKKGTLEYKVHLAVERARATSAPDDYLDNIIIEVSKTARGHYEY